MNHGIHKLGQAGGLELQVLEQGARLAGIRVPSPKAVIDGVLSYPQLADFANDPYFLGATLGRYAGRIRNGQLPILGRNIRMPRDEAGGTHCLHGGASGFHMKRWKPASPPSEHRLILVYDTTEGEGGFPGRLHAEVEFEINSDMEFTIRFSARTDQATVVNMSNHSYFNLHGNGDCVFGHSVQLASGQYAPCDHSGLPSGTLHQVQATPFDFHRQRTISRDLISSHPELEAQQGFDHFYRLDEFRPLDTPAARLYSPISGLQLECFTDHSGLQFYSGNNLAAPFKPHQGLCLEFQDCPDAPNLEGFPYCLLQAGDHYCRFIRYRFSFPAIST